MPGRGPGDCGCHSPERSQGAGPEAAQGQQVSIREVAMHCSCDEGVFTVCDRGGLLRCMMAVSGVAGSSHHAAHAHNSPSDIQLALRSSIHAMGCDSLCLYKYCMCSCESRAGRILSCPAALEEHARVMRARCALGREGKLPPGWATAIILLGSRECMVLDSIANPQVGEETSLRGQKNVHMWCIILVM